MIWTWQRLRDALVALEFPNGEYCAGATGLLLADGTMRGTRVVEVLVTPQTYADLAARGWRPMDAGLESPTDDGLVAMDPAADNTYNVPDALARATEVDGVRVVPADLVTAEVRRAVVALNLILEGQGVDMYGNPGDEPERQVYGGAGAPGSAIISPESQQALLDGAPVRPEIRRQFRLVLGAFAGVVALIVLGFVVFMVSRLGGFVHLTFQTDEVQGTLLSAEEVGTCGSRDSTSRDTEWRLEYEWEAGGKAHRDTLDRCSDSFEIGETESIWVRGDDVRSTNSPGGTWAAGAAIIVVLAGGSWFFWWRKRRTARRKR